MLSKTEKLVMNIIYEKCANVGSCLITVDQITKIINAKSKRFGKKLYKKDKIISAIKSLELDNYYELICCQKNDEEVYCINLKSKGYSFNREKVQEKRAVINKIIFVVLTAIITYVVGKLLIYFFQ